MAHYLSLAPEQWSAVAADLRTARPAAPDHLFAEQATDGRSSDRQAAEDGDRGPGHPDARHRQDPVFPGRCAACLPGGGRRGRHQTHATTEPQVNPERVVYRPPKPRPDGRTALSLTPLELLDRLAALIPPPRRHHHRYHGVLAPHAPPRIAPARGPPGPTRWRFDRRPPGFELAAHDLMEDGRGAVVEHFVFSDQLSSYSLFIEPGAADGLRGATRIGAVHAAGGLVNGHQVTAVGEVPAATVAAAVAGLGWAADGAPP